MTGQHFGRFPHHQARQRIIKAIAIHAIDQFGVTHAHAEARPFGKVGNARHALGAAPQDDVGAVQHNLFSGQNDRAQPGPAGLFRGKGRHAIRHSGAKSNLSRDVRPTARLPRTTPD